MREFWIFLIAGLGTYLIRISGIVLLGGDRELPPRLMRSLRLVGPAAMSAIIANSLLLADGAWRPFGAWHIAALLAIGVAVWRRSMGLAMASGAVLFAILLLAGA